MIWLGAGVLGLVLLLLSLNSLAKAPPDRVARAALLTLLTVLGLFGGLLLITGKFLIALPVLASAAAGLFKLAALLRLFGARASWTRPRASQNKNKSADDSMSEEASTSGSDVASLWLSMHLDHDSGEIKGTVLDGPYQGLKLSALSFDDLIRLLHDLYHHDPEGSRLLEAYLDRNHGPSWRNAKAHEAGKPDAAGTISLDEARKILGVSPDASPKDIRAAYHRLMKKVHPDQGGSAYFAAKLNEAKDRLLHDKM
jgi:DnaJ-domain-containing protein 1